jgi:hypothetical protein
MKRIKAWFMNIKDKRHISKNKYCPPHTFPHKLPFGEKIKNEQCHIHKNKLRMFHHLIYCKLLKCPNYNFMIKNNKKLYISKK